MGIIGDSSDKTIEIKPTPLAELDRVVDRVRKGYAITPRDAMLLLNVITEYERAERLNNAAKNRE